MDRMDIPDYRSPTLTRRITSQMNISMPVDLHEKLRAMAWQQHIPLSHLCRALLTKGLEVWQKEQEDQGAEGAETEGK